MLETFTIENETGCWVWTGKTCANGRYGRAESWPIKMAHRVSYEENKGAIPDGMCVCHTCDNGLCINPDHLFLGTASDNMRDAIMKGRLAPLFGTKDQRGEKNANAKYDRDFARRVRDFYSTNNPSYAALAKHFGLKSKGHAHKIVKNIIWKQGD